MSIIDKAVALYCACKNYFRWKKFIKQYNLIETQKNIAAMYSALYENAKSKDSELYTDENIYKIHSAFMENPCIATASSVVTLDNKSIELFIRKGETQITVNEWKCILLAKDGKIPFSLVGPLSRHLPKS